MSDGQQTLGLDDEQIARYEYREAEDAAAGRPSASLTILEGRLEPVEIVLEGECEFAPKPCALCGKSKGSKVHTPKRTATCPWKRQNGCATCGRPKNAIEHMGAPPSLNVFAGTDPNIYRSLVEQWKGALEDLLDVSDLPRGLTAVYAEGEAIFDRDKKRDQGNHRVMLEKALGDALVEGGWLEADTWDHYEFGGLTQRIEPGRSATRLLIFPRA